MSVDLFNFCLWWDVTTLLPLLLSAHSGGLEKGILGSGRDQPVGRPGLRHIWERWDPAVGHDGGGERGGRGQGQEEQVDLHINTWHTDVSTLQNVVKTFIQPNLDASIRFRDVFWTMADALGRQQARFAQTLMLHRRYLWVRRTLAAFKQSGNSSVSHLFVTAAFNSANM